jgi:DNA gyrase subunit A
VVAAVSLDARAIGDIGRANAGGDDEQSSIGDADVAVPPVHALAVTSDGYSLRFSLANFAEPSTRSGRRFARPAEGAEVVGVSVVTGDETVIAATRDARAMLCPVSEVNFLAGPGKGVILIKLVSAADRVLGFVASTGDRDLLTVETSRGAEQTVSTAKYEVTGRGGKGRELLQRGQFTRIVSPPAVLQVWDEES